MIRLYITSRTIIDTDRDPNEVAEELQESIFDCPDQVVEATLEVHDNEKGIDETIDAAVDEMAARQPGLTLHPNERRIASAIKLAVDRRANR